MAAVGRASAVPWPSRSFRAVVVVCLAGVAFTVFPVYADTAPDHCGSFDLAVGAGSTILYVDGQDDGTWIYEEDTGNVFPGDLQRGGTWYVGLEPPCQTPHHDRIVAFVPIV